MPSKSQHFNFTIEIHIGDVIHEGSVLCFFQKCEGPVSHKTLRYEWIMKAFLMSERNIITLQGWDILFTPQVFTLVYLKQQQQKEYLFKFQSVSLRAKDDK